MKNVYILHGCCDQEEFEDTSIPSGSNFHWIPWLQKQLIVQSYNCQTPEMPTPYKPSYQTWKRLFEAYPVDEATTLVGHSCGCGFFLRWLSENKNIKTNKLVLVAPYLDPEPYNMFGTFLKFALDTDLEKRVEEIHVFYSKDEEVTGVKETVDILQNKYPSLKFHEFENHGHFCLSEMGTEEFPELLEVIL